MLPLLLFAGVPAYFWVQGYGVIEARAVVQGKVFDVGTPLEGVLEKMNVSMGDMVRVGQELGCIDITELDAQVREKVADVAMAEAQCARLRSDWLRNDRLARQGLESVSVVESAYHASQAAASAVMAAKAARDATMARLKLATIRSPVAGTVLWEPLQPGSVVDRDNTVVSILDDRYLWIVAYLPEDCRAKVCPGQRVDIEVEGIPDRVIPGRVAVLFKGVQFRPRGLRTYDTPAETYQPVKIVAEDPALLRGQASFGMRATVTIYLH